MVVELKSDWLNIQMEILKSIHGFEMEGFDDSIGSLDYVATANGHEKKLLRLIIDQEENTSKANTETIRSTIKFLENEDYDEVTILAEEVTEGAKILLREEKSLDYITQSMGNQYSIAELLEAIQKKTREQCTSICGKLPVRAEDCKGYQSGSYSCQIRRISDNSFFHAERKWVELLVKDFSKLITLQEDKIID